jgi:hypothetical protein
MFFIIYLLTMIGTINSLFLLCLLKHINNGFKKRVNLIFILSLPSTRVTVLTDLNYLCYDRKLNY